MGVYVAVRTLYQKGMILIIHQTTVRYKYKHCDDLVGSNKSVWNLFGFDTYG